MVIINDIQSLISKRRTAVGWKSINEFWGRKSTPLRCINASSFGKVKETLSRHYANVINRPLPPTPINDDDDVTTVSHDLDAPEVSGHITTAKL